MWLTSSWEASGGLTILLQRGLLTFAYVWFRISRAPPFPSFTSITPDVELAMFRLSACWCFSLAAVVSTAAWAQPSVTHALPGAVRPGQTTEITLHGAKLDGALNVWSNLPAKFEIVPVEADKKDLANRVCQVTLDPNVSVGMAGVIVGNTAGHSDVLFLLVDDLPSVADNGNNHSTAQAQTITVPSAVDGMCDGTAFDYYKITAKKDQRVSIEVVAARMASTLDAVVRLLDPAGQELLIADDDASFGADCRFAFKIPADGEYLLEVRDNQFRSGGRYRLRVGDFPLVSAPYPLGGRFGSTMRFKFTGPFADSALPVFLRLPDELPGRNLPIAAKFPSGQSSGMATIVASRLPDIVESEPNNDIKIATLTSLPCAVNGTFDAAQDRDYYQFAATKGQSMLFRAVSRSMGSPSYLFMRLYNIDGGQLAEAPINDADETSLSFTFPADGMYCLMVEDLLNRGGPEYAYRVEVEPNDGFALTLKQDNNTRTKFVTAMNTGAFALTVQVSRRNYDGPIQLSLADPAVGFGLHNTVIPEKANEQRVIVVVPAGTSAGALHALRLIGSATVLGREVRATMQTTPTLRARLPQLAFPPAWLDGLMTASIAAESPPLFQVASSVNPIPFSRGQAQSQFNVTLERKNAEFKDAITLLVEGLPAGFAPAVKQDKDTYQVTITGPKDAPNGRRDIRLVAYGELKGSGQIVRLDLPLEVKD